MPPRLLATFGATAALLAAACNGTSGPSGGTLALGTWGAVNAGVIATDSITHVHIGCTFGDMPGDIELDEAGRFTVDGSYVLRAYPIQVDPPMPAQFSGQVRGRVLTLAVAVNDTVQKKVVALGPITVIYGHEPQMGPCPICAVPRRAYRISLAPQPLAPYYLRRRMTHAVSQEAPGPPQAGEPLAPPASQAPPAPVAEARPELSALAG